jgi:hypothetical protein
VYNVYNDSSRESYNKWHFGHVRESGHVVIAVPVIDENGDAERSEIHEYHGINEEDIPAFMYAQFLCRGI